MKRVLLICLLSISSTMPAFAESLEYPVRDSNGEVKMVKIQASKKNCILEVRLLERTVANHKFIREDPGGHPEQLGLQSIPSYPVWRIVKTEVIDLEFAVRFNGELAYTHYTYSEDRLAELQRYIKDSRAASPGKYCTAYDSKKSKKRVPVAKVNDAVTEEESSAGSVM